MGCLYSGGKKPAETQGAKRCVKWAKKYIRVVKCVQLSPQGVCAINGLLYVIGGDDGSCNLSSVEFYNPATDKWSLIPTNMSNGRSYAGKSDHATGNVSTSRREINVSDFLNFT